MAQMLARSDAACPPFPAPISAPEVGAAQGRRARLAHPSLHPGRAAWSPNRPTAALNTGPGRSEPAASSKPVRGSAWPSHRLGQATRPKPVAIWAIILSPIGTR
ncbi:hypothetical protein DB30_04612 [Enhygromyxa salina]|uniref:Uncharacterized protein n=1 Tax=Enhygromyxa salina TaxID=215803 RepID=A0A0C2DHH2_9BACT|nr:hypothetical protein DB30_04612 [Enhygromyxa salina]